MMILYGQIATVLQYEPKGNILFAGGKDGTIKCYLLDASLNGQWFLNFQIEEENIMLEEKKNNAHSESENNPEKQEDGKDGNNTDNQD